MAVLKVPKVKMPAPPKKVRAHHYNTKLKTPMPKMNMGLADLDKGMSEDAPAPKEKKTY